MARKRQSATTSEVDIGPFRIGAGQPLALIAGPCVIESTEHCLRVGERVAQICRRLGIHHIFKCSFDKANRTSIEGFRGPGIKAGLKTLAAVRKKLGVPVLTDVHLPEQAGPVGKVCDVLQIPAFLCRQTDLLVAAAETGRPVNVKKGQFMSPEQMAEAVNKVRAAGNDRVLLTDRGTFFGYGRLVNDFTCIPAMQRLAPVVFDATHSCQIPGGLGSQSGGLREYVPILARAAMAAGADALFIEVHDRPDSAKSDKATVYPLDGLEELLATCVRIREAVGG
ncbi:MAG TPA: 3-deoxy-8-phosphooctulonate synthase [Phycisphaerae bacterium]|nr:3-deoxy-8-phosphooctulonate synthase [Phycisphaerae bacterium]